MGFALVLAVLQWIGQICPPLALSVILEAWQDKGKGKGNRASKTHGHADACQRKIFLNLRKI